MVDSIGAQRGMHYYNFPLVSAMNQHGTATTLVSTDVTCNHPLLPDNVPAEPVFQNIYGDLPKWRRGLNYSRCLRNIQQLAKREKPDVIHFHFFQIPWADYALLQSLHRQGVKTVATVHDVLPFDKGNVDRDKDLQAGGLGVFHRLYHQFDGLVLHSQYALDLLADVDAELAAKAIHIRHGNFSDFADRYAGIESLDARRSLGLPATAKIVLVFGTIKPNKRLDLMLRAMRDVIDRFPDAILVIAGKPRGQDVEERMAQAADLGIAGSVIWRPDIIPDEEVPLYFTAADIVFYPYEWVYQSGALLMGMSFGRPVVATNVGGNPEYVSHGEDGYLVPADDWLQWARVLVDLFHNPDTAAAMGESARSAVRQRFAWDGIAEETLDFYRSLTQPAQQG